MVCNLALVPLGSSNQASLKADIFNSALKASYQQVVCFRRKYNRRLEKLWVFITASHIIHML